MAAGDRLAVDCRAGRSEGRDEDGCAASDAGAGVRELLRAGGVRSERPRWPRVRAARQLRRRGSNARSATWRGRPRSCHRPPARSRWAGPECSPAASCSSTQRRPGPCPRCRASSVSSTPQGAAAVVHIDGKSAGHKRTLVGGRRNVYLNYKRLLDQSKGEENRWAFSRTSGLPSQARATRLRGIRFLSARRRRIALPGHVPLQFRLKAEDEAELRSGADAASSSRPGQASLRAGQLGGRLA